MRPAKTTVIARSQDSRIIHCLRSRPRENLWMENGRIENLCIFAEVTRPRRRVASATTDYWLLMVTPGQSSVRNGVSGRPPMLNMLHTGLSAQA